MFLRAACYVIGAGVYGYNFKSPAFARFLIENDITSDIRVGVKLDVNGKTYLRKDQISIKPATKRRLTKRQLDAIKLVQQASQAYGDFDYISVYFDEDENNGGKHGSVTAINCSKDKSALIKFSNVELLQEQEMAGVVYQALAKARNNDFATSTSMEYIIKYATYLTLIDYGVQSLIRKNRPFSFLTLSLLTLLSIPQYTGMVTVTPLQRYMHFRADRTATTFGHGESLKQYLKRCSIENPEHERTDFLHQIQTSDVNYSDRIENINRVKKRT